jgi:hypothetical protein
LINSIAICLLAAIQYIVLRQIGVMLVRLGPGYARPLNQGPRQGEDLRRKLASLWAHYRQSLPTLYIFASSLCPICESIRKACTKVAPHWLGVADIVFIYQSDEAPPQKETANVVIWSHPQLMDELDIRLVPYGVMTDATTTVIGNGLISNASQLESLLEYAQTTTEPGAEKDFISRPNSVAQTEVSTNAGATH